MIVIMDGDQPMRCFSEDERTEAEAYFNDLSSVTSGSHYLHWEECPLGLGKVRKGEDSDG